MAQQFKSGGFSSRSNNTERFIQSIEKEAWLTYKRLTSPNPNLNIYLDGKRTRIALFYAALYASEKLYAGWEE